jgi:hypothetical protein
MNIFATTPLSPSALVPSKGDRNVTWPLQIMPFLKVITILMDIHDYSECEFKISQYFLAL